MDERGSKRRASDVSGSDLAKRKSSKKKKSKNADDEKRRDDEKGEKEEEGECQRLSALLSTLSQEQMQRYEAFRRSHFDRNTVKKLMKKVSGCKVSNQLAVAMGGISKIFAGELIELAREEMGDFQGPIHPLHIRSAYRRLRRDGKIPYLNTPVRGLLE